MLAWMAYMAPSQEEIERMQRERAIEDSLRAIGQTEQATPTPTPDSPEFQPTEREVLERGIFGNIAEVDTLLKTVETPLFRITFTNIGGGPSQFELIQHRKWDGNNVTLINDTTRSAYNIGFLSTDNYNIDTNELIFTPRNRALSSTVAPGETLSVIYDLIIDEERVLSVEYVINGDTYEIQKNIDFSSVRDLIGGSYFELGWVPKLNITELDRAQETAYSGAYAYSRGATENIQLTSQGRESESFTGNFEWVATKSKFFSQIILPFDETDGAILTGEYTGSNDNLRIHYTSAIRSIITDSGINSFNLYVGPLDFYTVRDFHPSAYDMVDTGFRFLRWFSDPLVKWVVVPFFSFFGGLLPNMGWVIILFAFVIKLVLYPLTKKSFESMAAMRELQPEMKAIQEKYKDNPQAQQQATMKLFKKAKVNPLGGCLPNLLQAPVLITLWRYFQNAIELRQESFLWASDLSAPDPIINLPFSIPVVGDYIGGFVLLMSLSMVIQMKVSGQGSAGNPQFKFLQYILPIVLFVFFNQFASGLSLYYLVYNALSIGQQMLINKQIDHVKMMETVDKKKARQMAKEQKEAEKKKLKESKKK